MPTRNVSLTKELDQFIAAKVGAGLYANASEVMRAALRLLEREEREYEERMAALRAAIAEGDASPDAEEGVFEGVVAYIDELAAGKADEIAEAQCRQPRSVRLAGDRPVHA
jgi:antitoxin ParD1/3/4